MNKVTLQQILASIKGLERRLQALEGIPSSSSSSTVDSDAQENTEEVANSDLILSIVNKIGDCDENEAIQSKILDKVSMEGKILLCFYISHKYFNNAWLTSGDIEAITSDLGIKLGKANASNKMIELRKYLEAAKTRQKGRATPCRLNRKGVLRFEEILHGKND
jgi:hypothetical protein